MRPLKICGEEERKWKRKRAMKRKRERESHFL